MREGVEEVAVALRREKLALGDAITLEGGRSLPLVGLVIADESSVVNRLRASFSRVAASSAGLVGGLVSRGCVTWLVCVGRSLTPRFNSCDMISKWREGWS